MAGKTIRKFATRKFGVIKTAFVCLLVIGTMVLQPVTAALAGEVGGRDNKRSIGEQSADLFLMRPVGVLAVLAGTVAYGVTIPFSYFGGNSDAAYQRMVVRPVEYTFKRPLGDF
jgi:preprotein translocase subunit SecG